MATFDVTGLDDMMDALQLEAERVERNGPDAAMAGARTAVQAMQGTVPVDTGGLMKHIKAKGPFFNTTDGHHADVFPTGKNERGERYETIGFVLEYGRSNMPARPWMRNAVEKNSDKIGEAIEKVLMRD